MNQHGEHHSEFIHSFWMFAMQRLLQLSSVEPTQALRLHDSEFIHSLWMFAVQRVLHLLMMDKIGWKSNQTTVLWDCTRTVLRRASPRRATTRYDTTDRRRLTYHKIKSRHSKCETEKRRHHQWYASVAMCSFEKGPRSGIKLKSRE